MRVADTRQHIAIGSVIIEWSPYTLSRLPAGLANAGKIPAEGHIAEADTAQSKLTHVSVGSAADGAAVVGAAGKLGFPGGLYFKRSTRHYPNSLLSERHAQLLEQELAFLVRGGGGHDGNIHALRVFDAVGFHFREDRMFLDPRVSASGRRSHDPGCRGSRARGAERSS